MDDRQTEIRAGAGLEDSRINKEFIDFLNKWSSPVILVIAIAALVWAGLGWMERKKIEKIDQAFGDLHAATVGGNPSPASLNALAEEYTGVKSVSQIAKLTTADLYISAFVRGVQPGAQISPLTGGPLDENDALDDGQRQVYLDQADDLVQDVITTNTDVVGKEIFVLHALVRAGAIDECKRDFDAARASYERAMAVANSISMPALANYAQMRIDALGSYDADLTLPSREDLVSLPGEEVEELPQATEEADAESDVESSEDEDDADAETTSEDSESESP